MLGVGVKDLIKNNKGAHVNISERTALLALKDVIGVSKKSIKQGKIIFPVNTLGVNKSNLDNARLVGLSPFQNKAVLRLACKT